MIMASDARAAAVAVAGKESNTKTVVHNTSSDAKALNLANIRKSIPEAAFKKSLLKSFYYFSKDLSLWLASVVLIHTLVNSSLWESLPFWQQAVATLVYWNVAGFFMWCLFVIGHDCGHSTFSNYESYNTRHALSSILSLAGNYLDFFNLI